MRNIKLTLQYDGTAFLGLELQPGKKTIRGELERALKKLFKTAIKITSVSRTDSGVHALCQVVNFHLDHPIKAPKLLLALNSRLPETIRVISVEEVSENFNARYAAKSKEYEYLIFNGDVLSPFYQAYAWHVKPKLDLPSMRKAARVLKGKHNFASFCARLPRCAKHCGQASRSDDKDFVRTLYKVSIRKRKVQIWDSCKLSVVSCKFIGNGFLYKMVRNMVGTLVEVGLGRRSVVDFRKVLRAKDRKKAGRTAPAQGLCLLNVNY